MKKNMGALDRIIRMLLAALFILLYVFDVATGTLGYILLGLAAVFIFTSIFNFCPLYFTFGLSTRGKSDKN
jgi:hypothetical protein